LNNPISLLNNLAFAFLAALLLTTISLLVLLHRTNQNGADKTSLRLRDHHQILIPRWGGIGILIGWLASLLLLAAPPFEELSSPLSGSTIWLLVIAVLACGLGFLDDQQNLRARYKLLGQLALGIFTAAVVYRPDTLALPLIGLVEIGWLGGPLMVLWIIGVMNAINLVDGLDGLAGGLSLVTTLLLGALCWWAGEFELVLFSLALAGAIFGFWLFNNRGSHRMFELMSVLVYFIPGDPQSIAEKIFGKIVAEGNVAGETLSFLGQVDLFLVVHLDQLISLHTLQGSVYRRCTALETLC
jgi:UDP-N-acetylmuramyl pentapeptide phosphotransferase/UDP-N-acetylglucosamine-1-phosphate transferase